MAERFQLREDQTCVIHNPVHPLPSDNGIRPTNAPEHYLLAAGRMHLTAAAGSPCAAIFSAHGPSAKKWLPNGEHNLIFRANPPCARCKARICPKGGPAPCLESIPADQVFW